MSLRWEKVKILAFLLIVVLFVISCIEKKQCHINMTCGEEKTEEECAKELKKAKEECEKPRFWFFGL